METLLREYFPILVFLAIAGAISIAMVAASFIVARQRPNTEKLSPYECGFDPFGDALDTLVPWAINLLLHLAGHDVGGTNVRI